MSIKGSNLSIVKKKNSQLIREILYDNSPISRTEIAQRIALSLPTVTTNISQLITEGAVVEFSPAQEDNRQLGRKPLMLDYSLEYGFYVGVDLSPYWTYVTITDLRGGVRFSRRHDLISENYDAMLAELRTLIPQDIQESGLPRGRIQGVGLCLPGFIDAEAGLIHNCMRKSWNGHHLQADLEEALQMPVHIENNVRARAVGYDLFQQDQAESPMLYYFISHGLGCSLVINREVLSGASAGAGEIGHMVADPSGPVCATCGNRGCLEVMASEGAIVRQCRNIMKTGLSSILSALCDDPDRLYIADVLKAQACGDAIVINIINKAIRHIGLNIANLANFVSPGSIIIDSNLFTNPDNQALVMDVIRSNVFSYQHKKINITFLPHDSYSGAVGAAATAVKTFFLEKSDD